MRLLLLSDTHGRLDPIDELAVSTSSQ